MSVNVTITIPVPIAVINAIRSGKSPPFDVHRRADPRIVANEEAITAAVRASPSNEGKDIKLDNLDLPPRYEELESFTVNVKDMTGKTSKHAIDRTTTAFQLALKIQESRGIPPDQQRLIHGGRQLFGGHEDEGYEIVRTLASVSVVRWMSYGFVLIEC